MDCKISRGNQALNILVEDVEPGSYSEVMSDRLVDFVTRWIHCVQQIEESAPNEAEMQIISALLIKGDAFIQGATECFQGVEDVIVGEKTSTDFGFPEFDDA